MHLLTLYNLLQVINENVAVWDSSGKEIESQLLPLLNVSVALRKYHVMAYLGKSPNTTPSYWLAFSATVPPLGFSTYIVSSTKWAG
jgi:alpha-mannosidase